MMKRLLLLLTAMLLIFCATAQAADVYLLVENAMYRIYLRQEGEDLLLGNGVLMMDHNLLLAPAVCAVQGDLYALGKDGEHAIAVTEVLDDSGLALLQMATSSAGTPLNMANAEATGIACIFSTDAAGKLLLAPLNQVRSGVFHHLETLVLSSDEGLLPGGILADEKGNLIGITIAQQTEGLGTYFALDANGIHRAITRQQYADAFLPVTASWADGILTVSWTDDQPRTEGVYLISVCGGDNSYYTHYEAAYTEHSIQLTVPPGYQYLYQVQWAKDMASTVEPVWGAMSGVFVPSDSFNGYGYTQRCELVTRAGEKAPIQPLETPTAQVLADSKLIKYLQVTASYQVEEKTLLPMTIELTTPDGQFFYESAMCIFNPEKAQKDVFLLPLNDLIRDCSSFSGGELAKGEYLLRYTIDGGTAGEYAFTLADAAELPPEELTSGLISNISAEYNNGLLTLTWPTEGIPEDAFVDAFFLYDGNTYYVYHRIPKGENTTDIFTVPGRQIMAWVNWALDETTPPNIPQTASEYILIPAVEEAPYTLNNFRNVRLSLAASTDPHAAEKGVHLPAEPITREILSDPAMHFYFQTEDTYTVSAMSEDHPMNIVLTTPEGLCFISVAAFVFDPALQASDVWLMDVTELFQDYASLVKTEAWPAGEYRIMYCIDGLVVNDVTFTLE